MPLKSCHRLTHDTREVCRYLGRLTDVECSRCILAKANPPERRATSWWNYRRENEDIRRDLARRPQSTEIKTNDADR